MKVLTKLGIEFWIEGNIMITYLSTLARAGTFGGRLAEVTSDDNLDFKVRGLNPIQGLSEFGISSLIGQVTCMNQHITSW